jgi:hypothetical protein
VTNDTETLLGVSDSTGVVEVTREIGIVVSHSHEFDVRPRGILQETENLRELLTHNREMLVHALVVVGEIVEARSEIIKSEVNSHEPALVVVSAKERDRFE